MVAIALVLAELGRRDEAQSVFDRCAGTAFSRFAARGLRVMSVVADVCWLLDDRDRAAATYDALLPHSGRHVVDGIAAYSLGASDRSLAQMATLLERWDEAAAHFAAAHRLHERWGAKVWAAHTQADEARMRLRRGRPGDAHHAADLVRIAAATYRTLGMTAYLTRLGRLAAPARDEHTEQGRWAREGERWAVTYGGTEVHLVDSKGMHYLGRLLRQPNQQLSAIELAGGELAAADAERTRQAVTRALKSSIDRVAVAHPALGAHLRTAVRIGTHSSYVPDPRAAIRWGD